MDSLRASSLHLHDETGDLGVTLALSGLEIDSLCLEKSLELLVLVDAEASQDGLDVLRSLVGKLVDGVAEETELVMLEQRALELVDGHAQFEL